MASALTRPRQNLKILAGVLICSLQISGDYTVGETPVPIPNTAVKPYEVYGTIVARLWESRKLPD